MPREFFRSCVVLILILGLAVVPAPQAVRAAGPWYVSTTGDDNNDCLSPSTPCATINSAIGKAAAGDTINVAVGTYTGTGDLYSITVFIDRNITLLGGWDATFTAQSGSSIVDGQNARRAIYINSGIIVTLERFKIQGGNNYLGGGGVTIDPYSVATISNSAISGNTAQVGGGISVGINAALNLNNSTVSGNKAFYSSGGGIDIYGGSLTILNSTIANNTASTNGGGLNVAYGTVITLHNSILANNIAASDPDCSGTINISDHNIISSTIGCIVTAGTGDQFNVDPLSGTFLPAQGYYPLMSGSPAIDAGDDGTCLTTDQRGVARVGICDIGAYEYTMPGPATSLWVVSGSKQITGINSAFSSLFQAAALDGQGSPVSGVFIEFTAPGSGPSGLFADTGINTTTVVTDQDGVAATSTFTANDQAGAYSVTASASGLGSVNFDLEQVVRPVNDNFGDAKAIDALPFSDSVDNTSASIEPGEPQNCYSSPNTVWYSFSPTTNTVVKIDMTGSSFSDTIFNIYQDTGGGIGSLNLVQCAYYGNPVTIDVPANVTYYIQAGSISNGGDLHLSVQQIPAPQNDNFVSATIVSALPFDDTANTRAASLETGEPTPSCAYYGSISSSVWYAFTPTTNGAISASIPSSAFTPVFAAYTGNSLDSLTEMRCQSYNGSLLTLQVSAGITYFFQIGNLYPGEQGGSIQLHLDVAPPPVASFYWYPYDPSVFDTIQFYDGSYDPAQLGIQSYAWNFGDGATATGSSPTHKYAADGNYTVQHTVTTVDGRTASITQVVTVKTHDVAIVKIAAPNSASAGQTRTITVTVRNKKYPETVTVDLYKSSPGGDVWVNSITLQVPVSSGNRTTSLSFNYTFTSQDAQVGKVTFRAVATIAGARDAYPSDNEAISSPPTKVSR